MKTKLSFNLFVILSLLLAALPVQTTHAAPVTSMDLLQFTAGSHVLGFRADGMYAAAGSHALHVNFVGANSVVPKADTPATTDGRATPLGQVTYVNLWDRISLAYTAGTNSLYSTTYTLEPGANPLDIRLGYNAPLTLNDDGTLSIAFETGSMIESAPLAWQEINGRKVPVDIAFRLHGQVVTFFPGDYDRRYSLTIDPSVSWNTFLGDSPNKYVNGIVVDGSGNIYVTGTSQSSWGSPVVAYAGGASDAFIARIDSTGSMNRNTFLGGSGSDQGYSIALDSDGNLYVTGTSTATWSASPVRAYTNNSDVFVARLTSSLALTWSTFLGGNESDYGYGIAVYGSGSSRYVYVAGTSSAAWSCPSNCTERDYTGPGGDGFVAQLSSSTGGLTWNAFLGGNGEDQGYSVAVDSDWVYVAGSSSAGWSSPTAYTSRAYTGGTDAFAAKLYSANGSMAWNTFLGGSGEDKGYSIATDGLGEIYVAGESSATWGAPKRAYSGGTDAFVAQLNSIGALPWNTFLGTSGTDSSRGIAVDPSGYVYVVGKSTAGWSCSPLVCTARHFTSDEDAFAATLSPSDGTLTWNTFLGGSGTDDGRGIALTGSGLSTIAYIAGDSTLAWSCTPTWCTIQGNTSAADTFAAKLSHIGYLTWNTFLGGCGDDYGNAISVDGSGNVFVAGSSEATWGDPVHSYTYHDSFVAKLNSSGGLTWNTFVGGGGGTDFATGIAVDGSGNVYLAGYSTATWGTPIRAYTSLADAFAAKLAPDGTLLWNTFLGGSGSDQGNGIAVDGSGNVYLTGYSTASWGTPLLTYAGLEDGFVAKLTSSGGLAWSTFLGGSGDDQGNRIVVDGSGNVYVVGWSATTWGNPVRAFTPGSFSPDAFVAKLDPEGTLLWNSFLGGTGDDKGTDLSVDGSGDVYVVGWSAATWGSPVRAYTSSSDAFAAKLNPSGGLIWNTFLGGSGYDQGHGIAVAASGNICVAGTSFASWGAPKDLYTAGADVFVAELDSSGALYTNTFMGGNGDDFDLGLAGNYSGSCYLTGSSNAAWGSPLRSYNGSTDAFVSKVDFPPVVVSSLRASTNLNHSSSVDFTVTFSKAVTGVDASDFSLTKTGSISGESVTGISGGPTVYTVTAATGSGDGDLRLDVNASGTGIQDLAGNPLSGGFTSGEAYTVDKTPPTVVSSFRTGASNPTHASSVDFTVTFSESVTGVDASDFALTTTGSISGESVTGVIGGPTAYTVTAATGSGDGDLRLDVKPSGTGIQDLAGNPLSGGYTSGDTYTIDRTVPTVVSSLRAGANPTNAASVDFTVTFSEPVMWVGLNDFDLTTTGTISGAAVTGVSSGPTTYTVTVNTGTGNGDLRLNIVTAPSIQDMAGNALAGPYTGGNTYTVNKTYQIYLPLVIR